MSRRANRGIAVVVGGLLIGLSLLVCASPAGAQPTEPVPSVPATSSTDELTDMVMDAIESESPPPPTTTVPPTPPA